MPEGARWRVAIVDYGMGNVFSVKHACEQVGLGAVLTSSKEELLGADAVILPGVGAFGDAMEELRRRDLIGVLREAAADRPFLGICLGMQLLMTESHEFGRHEGLAVLDGDVVRLGEPGSGGSPGELNLRDRAKVPQVGWNQIHPAGGSWEGTYLESLEDGTSMYFVHSFVARPREPGVVVSVTRYGSNEFCSSLQRGHLFACQFHPERSGPHGLRVYQNLSNRLRVKMSETRHV